MSKTAVVVGYGSGVSSAVAEKLGAEGFSVAIVARSAERLTKGVKELEAKGIKAAPFVADAGDPASIRAAIRSAKAALGPIAVVHWNAYGGAAGDVLAAEPGALHSVFDVAVVGLVTAVREALPDLKETRGAVLVTNGAFGDVDPKIDAFAVGSNNAGLALANAAKHKLVGLLAARLKDEGVYVGEVVIAGTIKGSAWDKGDANLEASAIASAFWDLYRAREVTRARVP